MSRVVMGRSKIEGRICPRTRVEDRGRYLGIPRTERFRILECPGNRVRYNHSMLTVRQECDIVPGVGPGPRHSLVPIGKSNATFGPIDQMLDAEPPLAQRMKIGR
jgi:hypothetical protein